MPKKQKNVGKKVVGAIKKVGVGGFGSIMLKAVAAVMAVTLVITVISSVLMIGIANYKSIEAQVLLTPKGSEIMYTLKAYTNDLYQSWPLYDYDERFGVDWGASNRNREIKEHDDDDERGKYQSTMKFIEQNKYDFVLCGIWKTCMMDIHAENVKSFTVSQQVMKNLLLWDLMITRK